MPTRTEPVEQPKLNLYQKIAAIMGEIDAVEKEGFNANQKYRYITEATIANILRPLFAKYRIVPWHTLKEWSRPDRTTYTVETWRLIDADTGEMTPETDMLSEGMDVGDKASSKASTFSSKYFYLRQFVIGAGTGEEAEADEKTDKVAAAASAAAGPVRVGKSAVAGAGRGGKSSLVTNAQVSEIVKLVTKLKLDADAFGNIIHKVTGIDTEGKTSKEVFAGLTSDQAAGLVTALMAMDTFDAEIGEVEPPEEPSGGPDKDEQEPFSVV